MSVQSPGTPGPRLPLLRQPKRSAGSRTAQLKRAGFDKTRYERATGRWNVACSQCKALVINGVPTHEKGCSNA